MIVNLAALRRQRSATALPSAFDPGDPRRLNPISLEQQRKRAKELLRAWHAGEEDAMARLRRHAPRAAGQDPRLSDAQLVIARENGFAKWTDLKAHADHMRIARQAVRDGRPSALDRDGRCLHIRCGHDIMHSLAIAGFEGDFLWFADPYIEGPVPRTADLEEFVRLRAQYLEQAHGEKNAFERLYESYRDLEQAKAYASVHIWLEHDSYDQLILARLLDCFSDPAVRPPRLRLICVTHFPGVERFNGIGQLPPEALRLLWTDFQDIEERQLQLGRRAWEAITAPTPHALAALVSTQTPALPTLGRALARHLRELPSAQNGLSLTERLTLQILRERGPMSAPRLFGWYTNQYEPLPFMGDTGYWRVLRGLADAQQPAIRIAQRGAPAEWNRHWHVELLPFGETLLRNEADWLDANAVTRWVGGVRIDSRAGSNWRVDDGGAVTPG